MQSSYFESKPNMVAGAKGATPEVGGRYLNMIRDTYSDTTNVKYTLSRVAYPGGEASLRVPEGRIWPGDFLKKVFPGGRTKVQTTTSAGAHWGEAWRRNVWRPVIIRESFEQRIHAGYGEAELQW